MSNSIDFIRRLEMGVTVKYDNYGEVINDKITYEYIVYILNSGGNILIGWTDENASHYDILFSLIERSFGTIHGGVKVKDLSVSVMCRGAFSFSLDNDKLSGAYITDKLGVQGSEKEFEELVNGVISCLQSQLTKK